MPRALDEVERESIVAAIRNGGGRNEIARRFRRSPGLISKIAAGEGLEFERRSQTKRATETKRDCDRRERLSLINEGFDKARDVLPSVQTGEDMKRWALGVAKLIDRGRIEEGLPTYREEVKL